MKEFLIKLDDKIGWDNIILFCILLYFMFCLSR